MSNERPVPGDEIASDRLQPYRQPLITGTGIILGFVLNFAGAFVKSDTGAAEWVVYLVFALILAGVICLVIALARILRLGIPAADSAAFYQRTRHIFITGVSCAVAGALLDMLSTFVTK